MLPKSCLSRPAAVVEPVALERMRSRARRQPCPSYPWAAGLRSFPCNAWCLAFDNISYVPEWLADALCRLSTGGGYVTRALHTDREEIIFDASRPIILNGIPDLAGRPDLGDRAISITLSPIADDQRLTEKKLLEAFGKKQPEILGALLDAVSGALRNYEKFKLERPPRQPDRRAPALELESLKRRK